HTRCLSDWSSDVCSSDLSDANAARERAGGFALGPRWDRHVADLADDLRSFRVLEGLGPGSGIEPHRSISLCEGGLALVPVEAREIGRASCRERVEMAGGD